MAGIIFGGRVGYERVFWKTLSLQWGIFLGFAAATLLVVYGSFLALKRAHLPDLLRGQPIYIRGQPLNLPVEPVRPLTALGVSLVLAAAVGATAKRNTDASNRPSAKGIGIARTIQ